MIFTVVHTDSAPKMQARRPAKKRMPSLSFLPRGMCRCQMTFCVQIKMRTSRARLKLWDIMYDSGELRHLPSVIRGSHCLRMGLQANISMKTVIM